MKKIVFFTLCFIILIIRQANAQNALQEQIDAVLPTDFVTEQLFSVKEIPLNKATALGEYVSDFSLLETDNFVLNRIVNGKPDALEVDMPFNGGSITLQLITSRIIDKQTRFFSRSSSGKLPVNYNPGAYYYGVIKNQPNTLVAISFFNNNIIGVIADDTGNHVLGKSEKLNEDSNEYILYNDKDLLITNTMDCLTNDEAPDMLVIPEQPQHMMAVCDIEVGNYIETDHQIYLNQGSSIFNVLNFVTGLFNVTTTLYQNESINVAISETNVWTMADPYVGASDTSDAITIFENEMIGGFNGDLAHLFSARDLGGGIAYRDVLCADNEFRTAVSGNLEDTTLPFPNYSWNAMVVTHEMGHNLGSPHTHACAWNGDNTAIDSCAGGTQDIGEGGCPLPGIPPAGGTIMSYCHVTGVGINFNQGFGIQPGDLIRNRYTNAACLTEGCCNTDVIITGNNYNTALTESGTWIVSSGQTTIENTADVRLDADPVSGYIEFEPVAGVDFFLAEPIGDGVFVAEALDGCDIAIPVKTENEDTNAVNNDIKNTKQEDAVPEGFLLAQNIPNPFSEKTTIKAVLPDEVTHAEIVVYNLQGTAVASYPIDKRGMIAVEISGGKLVAGVYLYTLIADGRNIDTKKMILTR